MYLVHIENAPQKLRPDRGHLSFNHHMAYGYFRTYHIRGSEDYCHSQTNEKMLRNALQHCIKLRSTRLYDMWGGGFVRFVVKETKTYKKNELHTKMLWLPVCNLTNLSVWWSQIFFLLFETWNPVIIIIFMKSLLVETILLLQSQNERTWDETKYIVTCIVR